MTDMNAFKLGVNVATSKGKVSIRTTDADHPVRSADA